MNALWRNLLLPFLLLLSTSLRTQAISDGPAFADSAQEARYARLIRMIRCPTCQNQSIAESNAPLAKQLRDLVGEELARGKNDTQIITYLIARYGDFISYDPRLQKNTLLLWFGPPLVMLLVALAWLTGRYKRARRRERGSGETTRGCDKYRGG